MDAHVGRHTLRTDQPASLGGEDSAPSPFDFFLASLGTCAGFFVQKFCAQRTIASEGIRLSVRPTFRDGTLADVELAITLPPDFPAKYKDAVVRAVDQCSVKRAIQAQPTFTTHVLPIQSMSTPLKEASS